MKVTLYKDCKTEPIELDVEPEKVMDAGIVIHKGIYYTYQGSNGRFFQGAVFREVKTPVEL